MPETALILCTACNATVPHLHLHSTSHVFPGEHVAGTERFICTHCSHQTFRVDAGSGRYPFAYDYPVLRTTETTPCRR